MSDERRLHDALADLVPVPPSVPDRASGARARARGVRRGRVATGVGAVLGAVAIAVPVVIAGGSDPVPQHNTPEPGVVAGQFPCPPPSGRLEPEAPLEGPDKLPAAPIAARFCFNGGLPWQAPQDAVLSGLDEIVSFVNDLHKQRYGGSCPANLGPTWAILFQYPDGYTQLVRGRAFGCGGISVGTITRGTGESADRVLNRVKELVREQRASSTPPARFPVRPACEHSPFGRSGDRTGLSLLKMALPERLASAVICWRPRPRGPWHTVPIRPSDLRVLNADLNAHASSEIHPSTTCGGSLLVTLNAVNVWGDEFSLGLSCDAFTEYWGEWFWRPDPRSQAILDRLIGGD